MSPPFVVGLAGGSGSGKTTLARALSEALGRERVAVLCHDAYYRDRSDLPPSERTALNYDVPAAFDQALFRAHLLRLRHGEAVRPPVYCFATHCRLAETGAVVAPREIVLVEGILLFHDPAILPVFDLKVFVDAPSPVRLARRIGRDTTQRNRTADSVVRQFTSTVNPAHQEYVEPTKASADLVVLNTSRLEPVVEVLTTVIRARMARQELLDARAQSA
jgi:uridine kinase